MVAEFPQLATALASPKTITSHSTLRAISANKVVLPQPAPANNPTRWPSPSVSAPSMARTPVINGRWMRGRAVGGGASPITCEASGT
jgi:hypothetical protein